MVTLILTAFALAKTVLHKHLLDVVSSDQIDMAHGMTLMGIQAYMVDNVTDAKLSVIDHDFATLKT